MTEPFTVAHEGRQVLIPRTGGVYARQHKHGRFYEDEMLAAIAAVGRPGVYVDVGASLGNHSAFFEVYCPSSRVIAFEPVDASWELLLETRRLNKLSFETHKLGLGASDDEAEVRLGKQTYRIETTTLDRFELEDVAVIKIDIEGMEPAALRGMVDTLRRCQPHLYIEAHRPKNIAEQRAVLDELGYLRTGRIWNHTQTFEWVVGGRKSTKKRRPTR